jgi:syndecan 2
MRLFKLFKKKSTLSLALIVLLSLSIVNCNSQNNDEEDSNDDADDAIEDESSGQVNNEDEDNNNNQNQSSESDSSKSTPSNDVHAIAAVDSNNNNFLANQKSKVSTSSTRVPIFIEEKIDSNLEDNANENDDDESNDDDEQNDQNPDVKEDTISNQQNQNAPTPQPNDQLQHVITYQSSRSKLLAIITKPGILAGIVGGAIIGILTAILLIMFIVYRMRKKDEGSYALEETKKPLNAYDYRHCPTKEFYA